MYRHCDTAKQVLLVLFNGRGLIRSCHVWPPFLGKQAYAVFFIRQLLAAKSSQFVTSTTEEKKPEVMLHSDLLIFAEGGKFASTNSFFLFNGQ